MSDIQVQYRENCGSCCALPAGLLQCIESGHLSIGTYQETLDLCFLYKKMEQGEPIIKIEDLPLPMQKWWENHKQEDALKCQTQ